MGDVEHFDAVVVGSGFGGAVAAYRLAQDGLRVCVLERGKPYPPHSFPRDPRTMATNFWDPSAGLHGMFDIWSFKGIEAVVSSGLGGGSLIYANVLLRKDEHWFTEQLPHGESWAWPISREDLDPHYDAVEEMLDATPFPYGSPGYRAAKTTAMRDAAAELEMDWQLPNLAVTFADGAGAPVRGEPISEPEYGNLHGRGRLTCTMCGECDIGCNVGAKNTLDHTYLSAAAHHGADIRTRCEVRRLSPRPGGGFAVGYVEHADAVEGRPTRTAGLPVRELSADRLIMAAGALGSTYLLLRNRSAFPRLGDALGTRFCGNGDLLGFLSGASDANGDPRPLDASSAPVITSTIRSPDEIEGGPGRGFYIQDAGTPRFADWLVEASGVPGTARRAARFALHRLWARLRRDPRSDIGAAISGLLGDGMRSATAMPLLGMGRDTPDGVMSLRRGYLDVDWTTESSASYFELVRTSMREIAGALGASFDDNPTYALKRVVTVHPLGGAPMGGHIGEGVVDQYGESFAYPGLFVLDGAAIPGPVGPNPALTIAAFADRASEHLLARRPAASTSRGTSANGSADARATAPDERPPPRDPSPGPSPEPSPGPSPGPSPVTSPVTPPGGSSPAAETVDVLAGEPAVTSVWFTEEMKGRISLGETDPVRGSDAAGDDDALMFRLTIRADDIAAFVDDPRHEGSATGWIDCELLGGRLPVQSGVFNLFVTEDDPTRRRMLYRLYFTDIAGHPLTLSGVKEVHDGPGFDVWSDTSTLYVTLLAGHVDAGHDADARVVAAGVLRILKADFARQLTTFRTAGPDAAARAAGLAAFGRLFLGELWAVYAPSFATENGR